LTPSIGYDEIDMFTKLDKSNNFIKSFVIFITFGFEYKTLYNIINCTVFITT